MMSWWHYLLLVNLYLILFFGFYQSFLRKETFFQLNRTYLVSASLLSFIIPLIQSNWVRSLFITQRVHQSIYATVNPQFIYQVKPVESNAVTLGQLIAFIYIIGSGFLLLRLIYQLLSLKKLVDSPAVPAAFSFFNKMNVDINLPGRKTIVEHELVHTRQWHSADVLLIEAVMIINWFNPVVYFYRKAIKHVHEYIADRKAIETGTSKTEYALLLLSQTFGTEPRQLTNNFFNHSLLKKRIMMLNQSDSSRRALLKYGLSAPLFGAMLVFSSATVNNSSIIKVINRKTEQAFSINTDQLKDSLNEPLSVTSNGTLLTATIPPVNIGSNPKLCVNNNLITNLNLRKDSIAQPDNGFVFNAVEIQPSFPGGEEGFGRFLQTNIRYPEAARKNNVQGRVFIQFTIEKDGSLSNMRTLRDPGAGLGDEAVRVLSASPKWLPGIQNGMAVRVQYTVPVNFSLADAPRKTTDTIRLTATTTAKKTTAMVFVYRQNNTDSLGKLSAVRDVKATNRMITSIRLNGKAITEDDMHKLDPNRIEYIHVIKRDTLGKPNGENYKQNLIIIKTRLESPGSKG